MKEISSTITSKGQVTIPAAVRKHLGLKQGDKVTFVLDETGAVSLKAPKYPTVASLAGAAGKLKRHLEKDELLEIAREDALVQKYRAQSPA